MSVAWRVAPPPAVAPDIRAPAERSTAGVPIAAAAPVLTGLLLGLSAGALQPTCWLWQRRQGRAGRRRSTVLPTAPAHPEAAAATAAAVASVTAVGLQQQKQRRQTERQRWQVLVWQVSGGGLPLQLDGAFTSVATQQPQQAL